MKVSDLSFGEVTMKLSLTHDEAKKISCAINNLANDCIRALRQATYYEMQGKYRYYYISSKCEKYADENLQKAIEEVERNRSDALALINAIRKELAHD